MWFEVLEKIRHFFFLQPFILLLASIFFGVIYNYNVPNIISTHEIRLRLKAPEMLGRKFSTEEFSLTEHGSSFFTVGQKYRIKFILTIPDCQKNRNADMSLVTLHLRSLEGNHSKSISNTFIPVFRPWLIEAMDTICFAPLYFLKIWRKEQKIIVPLAENYHDDREYPTGSGQLVMDTSGLLWYSATLVIVAVLNPISWLLYHYRFITGIVFVVVTTVLFDCLLLSIEMIRNWILPRMAGEPKPTQIRTVHSQAIEGEKERVPAIESLKPSALTKD
ncbi:hypothetical protein Aperf_G00000027107 [Anoplocephala perfoliata]